MSYNQWKILNQIKETLSKVTNEKLVQITVTKDLAQLLQKLPSNSDIIRFFDTNKASDIRPNSNQNIPSVISDKKDNKDKSKYVPPKWKRTGVNQDPSILSRTNQVIANIQSAESDNSLVQRIDSLISHINQYPETRSTAIKHGIIRLLLRLRNANTNDEVHASIREALAIFGYSNPIPKRGIRILSIDGGGIRGLLVLEMLKKLEELTGQRVHEMFDFFCGVSTGTILCYAMGIHRKSLDEISQRYESLSKEVFSQSAIWGTGSLVWSHAYYDTAIWEKMLKEHVGSTKLIKTSRDPLCPKMCSVSAVVNQKRLSAYLFRNYSLPWRFRSQYLGSSNHELWEAARASSAAPTYFDEFKLGNFLHQDGGILVNNPTAIALHEVKLIWPDTPIQCIVSFGTGRSVPSASDFIKPPESSVNTSWANKFYKILDSATDTEAVHVMINDLLPANVYYRFNPYLTEMLTMVETDDKKIEQLKRDALMYLRRNEDKFREAANTLMQEKTYTQKVKDYLNLQKDILGF